MTRSLILIFTGWIAAAGMAHAAPQTLHLRGTLQAVTANSVTLETSAGATQTVATNDDTTYALVSKSSLTAILPNSYVGVAAKGSGVNMTALEVVIFPPALRGVGEGYSPWDELPDITRPGAGTPSSMTNGSVSSIAVGPPKTASSMTNGSVQTVSSIASAKQISVVYKGGKQIILVLPTTPVVETQPASSAILRPGAHVFIFATGDAKTTAVHIIAGADGITPPM